MNILINSDKERWNEYIQSCHLHDGGFLQSWQWGEFQRTCKRRVWRIGEMKDKNIIFGWQVIEMPLLFGLKYWYVPRPIQIFPLRGITQRMTDLIFEIITQAKKERILFLRTDGGEDDLKKFGFRRTLLSVQPQEELIVDITKSEETLLAEMKPKTRYNVRVAQKHGVQISNFFPAGDHPKDDRFQIPDLIFENFYLLVQKTSQRQGIRAHAKEYYKKMFECLGQDTIAKLYIAQYQGKIIAAAIIAYFNGVATYLHGGTDDGYKSVMAPYLLHWKAILDAKAQGCARYNFGGVSSTKKSWEGMTRFKTGFAPNTEFMKYAGVWDLPLKRGWYMLYRLVKRIR